MNINPLCKFYFKPNLGPIELPNSDLDTIISTALPLIQSNYLDLSDYNQCRTWQQLYKRLCETTERVKTIWDTLTGNDPQKLINDLQEQLLNKKEQAYKQLILYNHSLSNLIKIFQNVQFNFSKEDNFLDWLKLIFRILNAIENEKKIEMWTYNEETMLSFSLYLTGEKIRERYLLQTIPTKIFENGDEASRSASNFMSIVTSLDHPLLTQYITQMQPILENIFPLSMDNLRMGSPPLFNEIKESNLIPKSSAPDFPVKEITNAFKEAQKQGCTHSFSFTISSYPELYFVSSNDNDSIEKQYRRILFAKAICTNYGLDYLYVPKVQLFSIEGSLVLAREAIPVKYNRDAYSDYQNAVKQLTFFLIQALPSKIELNDFPLSEVSNKIVLINLDQIDPQKRPADPFLILKSFLDQLPKSVVATAKKELLSNKIKLEI